MAEQPSHSFPLTQLVLAQLFAGLVLALSLNEILGPSSAVLISAAHGIFIATAVNSWYCWRVSRDFRLVDERKKKSLSSGAEQQPDFVAEQTIARLYRSELIKLLLAAVMLGSSFKFGYVAHDTALLLGFSISWLLNTMAITLLSSRHCDTAKEF